MKIAGLGILVFFSCSAFSNTYCYDFDEHRDSLLEIHDQLARDLEPYRVKALKDGLSETGFDSKVIELQKKDWVYFQLRKNAAILLKHNLDGECAQWFALSFFPYLWFIYLKHVAKVTNLYSVEGALHRNMATYLFDAQYKRTRERFYESDKT